MCAVFFLTHAGRSECNKNNFTFELVPFVYVCVCLRRFKWRENCRFILGYYTELSLHVDQILFPKAIIQTRHYILPAYRRRPPHMLSGYTYNDIFANSAVVFLFLVYFNYPPSKFITHAGGSRDFNTVLEVPKINY